MVQRNLFIFITALLAALAQGGIINPDISALGQVFVDVTDDSASANDRKPTLSLGETELIFDSPLNPYARGCFVFAIGDEGFEVEEAYFQIHRGLPRGLGIKAGKYRLGFGKLNAFHPHAYPFIAPPLVTDPEAAGLLPGEESFNTVAVQASYLLPTPGDWASTLSMDALQGNTFKSNGVSESTRLGWLARWGNAWLAAEQHPIEAGLSAAQGTNDPEAMTKTTVAGADLKGKYQITPQSSLLVQAEGIYRVIEVPDTPDEKRMGFFTFFDWRFGPRWNAGALYGQYQALDDANLNDREVRLFGGFSVMEETTLFRLALTRFIPAGADPVNSVLFQALFSMGPHKPHQF